MQATPTTSAARAARRSSRPSRSATSTQRGGRRSPWATPANRASRRPADGAGASSRHVAASAPGVAHAVQRLRGAGHRLRFLTNNTTQSRSQLAETVRGFGIELEDAELQTTPVAAARVLQGRRVLALTMPAVRDDLEGVELVGDNADAVLLGGADETAEPNRVFSYMNLARAFAELEAGADLFCLHKNPWWQTSR